MDNKYRSLEEKEKRYNELQRLLSEPGLISNQNEYKKCAKEFSTLQGLVAKYREYKRLLTEIEGLRNEIFTHREDSEFIKLADEELSELENRKKKVTDELNELILEKDSDADKDVIVEIRQGTGGIEAALFARDLFRMYTKYAAKMNWKTEIISTSLTEKGGFKEVIFSISGDKVYKRMRYESGIHRVQRVPITESSGRIHTSAASVCVLPEAEDVEIDIKSQDLKVDVFRASGKGGQHVNVTDSAVRITHLPTNIVVTCQDERSQHKNKAKAMRVLKARLLERKKQEQQQKISQERRAKIGSGDRSEKIRTYNFPERRVTDHRISLTLHKLDEILNGQLDEIIDALIEADKKERLKNL